jgi:Protein of unknown function (DUF2971).
MKNEVIQYLNSYMNQEGNAKYQGPDSLFKYRPFDEFTFDMLENNYLYLCPVEKLDDKTECDARLDLNRLMDLETNNLKRECVEQIIQMIRPYTSIENYEEAKSRIQRIAYANGMVRRHFMLDLSKELQNLVPDFDFSQFINYIVNIPEKMDDPSIRPEIEKLISMALNAKKDMGLCSLSESPNIEEMWKNYYAGDENGYCIEYDVSNYEFNKNILPVIYEDKRETNIIIQIVATFLNQMIFGMSNGQIETDKTQYIRLYLTKNKKWEYQREWRLIGAAGEKPVAPKINAIYLGKNVSQENKIKMIEYCKKMDIQLIERN